MVQPGARYAALLAGLLFSLGTGCTTPADTAPAAPAAPAATRSEGDAPAVPATAGAAPTSNSASVAFASFRLRAWTADDGFSGHASDIDQTPDGYLWIATDEGIFRFDGARFVAFTAATVPVFQSDNFLCLDVLPSGDLWVGTRDRWTYRLRDGEWTAYSIDKAFRGRDWVQGFVQDREGTVWASSAGRSVARFDGTRWMPVEQRIRGHWTPVVADAAGTIWTLLDTADVPGLPTSPLHTRQNSASESVVAQWDGEAFTPPRDGRLFGFERTQDGPLFHRLADTDDIPVSIAEVRGRRVLLSDADGTPRGSFVMGAVPRSAKLVDRAGRVWTELLASDGSLTVHVGDAEVARILPEGSRWIEHVFEDHQGNVWVLSSGGSLLQVTPEPFHRFGLDEGAPLSAESAFAAADGTVLVSGTPGAEESPLFSVRGEARASGLASVFSASFPRDGQPGDPTVGLVMQDGRGRAFGTWGAGLFQLDGFQSRMVWTSETGVDVRIPFPDAADADALWLGDIEGVLRRFDTEALVMTDSFQVPLPMAGVAWPTDVHRTPDGRLWVASRGGLVVVGEDGHPQPVRALAGVPVRDLADGPDGALWAATETRGLVRIRSGEVDALGLDHGLPTLQLVAVLFDDSGYVWLSGRSLLYRLRVADAERALDHAAPEPIDIVTLLPSAGHLGSAAVLSRAAKAPDGSFWIPSEKGVTRIDPQMYARQFAEPPPVLIEAVHTQSGERPLKAEASVRLPQGDRSPTVNYTAIDLTAPDLVRFQTQLVGLDDAWKNQGDARSIVYARLGPGTYTFRVRARTGGGLWTTPVEATLVIPAFFYETWWFAALCALSLLAALILGVRARERTLTARQRHLESVVYERTGQLRAEKDTVAAQAERLETLDAAKSAFFANVSHEFRTPLTLTLGPLDDVLAGEYGPVPDEAASPLALARRSAGRVLDLIGQILDLSRLEAGSSPLHARPLDLTAFARAQAEAFRPLAAHRRISLSVRASEAPAEVWADPEHVGTVLSNVLSNALKFTPEGGRVTIAVDAYAAHVRVSVRDSGPGIAAADLLRVFDRFYQVPHDEGRPLGTGIGLALAHDLAQLHGGTLTAESTPGEGSMFTLALPTGRAHLAPHQMHSEPWDGALRSTPVAEAPAADTRASPPGHDNDADDDRTTVLISDDNADIRAYIRRHLEAAGYRVDEAEDGHHALERIAERLPDLVVSDVMMPRLDGLGLCRALRASPETDFVPILLLTAKAAQEDRLDGLAEACDDYLTKPFDVRELVARVGNLIALRRRLRDRFAGRAAGDGASGDGASGDGAHTETPPVQSADEAFAADVRAAIAARLGDDTLTVSALARALGTSRSQLGRRTTAVMGASPSDLLRTARLDRATDLLAARAGTVSEVAYAVGFKSVAHFSNAFLAHTGERPSVYAEARG